METTLMPATQREEPFFYSNSDAEPRCIGHVRGDFGSGDEFWTTWWPHNDNRFNTEDFKAALSRVIDHLKDSLLGSLGQMNRYVGSHPALNLEANTYGYKVHFGEYDFFIRCTPMTGCYNFYVYCFHH